MRRLLVIGLCMVVVAAVFAGCAGSDSGYDSPLDAAVVEVYELEPVLELKLQENVAGEQQGDAGPATATFTNGRGGDQTATLAVGDSFLGFTLEHLSIEDDGGLSAIRAEFSGKATLQGRIIVEPDWVFAGLVQFHVSDEASLRLLPHLRYADYDVWLIFEDNEAAKQVVATDFGDFEIVIDSYTVISHFRSRFNTASLLSATPL